jgi:hypothetical protein
MSPILQQIVILISLYVLQILLNKLTNKLLNPNPTGVTVKTGRTTVRSWYHGQDRSQTQTGPGVMVKTGHTTQTGPGVTVKTADTIQTGPGVKVKTGDTIQTGPGVTVKTGRTIQTCPSVTVKTGDTIQTGLTTQTVLVSRSRQVTQYKQSFCHCQQSCYHCQDWIQVTQ